MTDIKYSFLSNLDFLLLSSSKSHKKCLFHGNPYYPFAYIVKKMNGNVAFTECSPYATSVLNTW